MNATQTRFINPTKTILVEWARWSWRSLTATCETRPISHSWRTQTAQSPGQQQLLVQHQEQQRLDEHVEQPQQGCWTCGCVLSPLEPARATTGEPSLSITSHWFKTMFPSLPTLAMHVVLWLSKYSSIISDIIVTFIGRSVLNLWQGWQLDVYPTLSFIDSNSHNLSWGNFRKSL